VHEEPGREDRAAPHGSSVQPRAATAVYFDRRS
jgi:hypothetical protein